MRNPNGMFVPLLVISVQLGSVFSEINNQYIKLFSPFTTTGRSMKPRLMKLELEGKFSYSVQLILHKGDSPCPITNPNSTSQEPIQFIVKAPQYSYYGIIAIIQSIHLRKSNSDDQSCRDYLRFMGEDEEESVEIVPSEKICGKLERDVHESEPLELIGPRIFFNPKGSIKLEVFVDPLFTIHDSDDSFIDIGAEIVFTAYTACPGTEVGLQTLKPCSSHPHHHESISCIPSALFCDSKIDCGFPEQFAIDEQYCYFPYIYGGVAVILIIVVVLIIYGFMQWVRIKAKRDLAAGGGVYYTGEAITSGGGGGESMCAAVESVDMDASMAAF